MSDDRYQSQEGTWTLTAPDGRTWTADRPLLTVAKESRERIPPAVALGRLMSAAMDTESDVTLAQQAERIAELERRYADASDDYKGAVERIMQLETALRSVKRSHHICEDCWYSCPASGECCNDNEGNECNCGADRHNAAIDTAISATAAPQITAGATSPEQAERPGRPSDTSANVAEPDKRNRQSREAQLQAVVDELCAVDDERQTLQTASPQYNAWRDRMVAAYTAARRLRSEGKK